jgi:hypothetical protein
MAERWTRAKLLRQLRRNLNTPGIKVTPASFSPEDCSAACSYDVGTRKPNAVILIDHTQDGALTMVLHELLHPVLDDRLDTFLNAELAEFAINGVEEGMLRALKKNAREYERWRNAIARKVKAE